jgi:hypothetical protein
MLEKITNIDTKTVISDKRRAAATYEKFIKKSQMADFFPKDSIAFSPAAIFLSQLNWFAKEVRFSSDNVVFLTFVISDLEFKTSIDFKNFYKDLRQTYLISQKKSDNYKDTLITAQISYKKEKIKFNEVIENYRLTGLKNLFSRIDKFSYGTKLSVNESYTLNELMDGIKEEILYELEKIQNAIYTFIQKFDKFKFNENYIFEYDGYQPVILERISKEYAG